MEARLEGVSLVPRRTGLAVPTLNHQGSLTPHQETQRRPPELQLQRAGGTSSVSQGRHLQATICPHSRPECLLQDQTSVTSVEGWAERPPSPAWGSCG